MVRRIVMWTAGVVLVLSVAAWVASLFSIAWVHQDRSSTSLMRGAVWLIPRVSSPPPGIHVNGWFGGTQAWRLETGGGQFGCWIIPVWMPATAAMMVFVLTWIAGNRERSRRRRDGLCVACAYDLTGITGPCPECGKER